MNDKAPLIAAIDVGTNSFHLIIASVNSKKMLLIHQRDKEVVRLGSGTSDMKYLLPEAIERGVKTLIHFSAVAKSENAEIRAVATSAVREALNKDIFLNQVKEKEGIDIEVISGDEEGRLIYIGALHSLPIYNQKTLVVDIGGGSTETIIGQEGEVQLVSSTKLGAVRLTRRFFSGNKITKKQIEECRQHIRGEWYPTLKNLQKSGFDSVIGTSGTIMNIALMALYQKSQPVPQVINGLTITAKEINEVIKKILSAITLKQRQAIPGIDTDRADIITAGALILEHFMGFLKIDKIVLSSYALREGIVFDTVQKREAQQQFHHLSFLRYTSVYNTCKLYDVDMNHAEHVKNLSLIIFDKLYNFHKLGFWERELLEAAALLHDVGYVISHDQHHHHSYYIILNCIMPGFTLDEAEIIANIARYHRKSLPKKKHENFQKLSPEKQKIVKVLAGILRIAEGIDRRKQQLVDNIEIILDTREIKINLIPASPDDSPDIELWGANRRKSLLEETLGKVITFELK
jgi:exopolyphosphatase/guanosine-5'-triphosphate,3'-diphosphate pyrophosphatase